MLKSLPIEIDKVSEDGLRARFMIERNISQNQALNDVPISNQGQPADKRCISEAAGQGASITRLRPWPIGIDRLAAY
jgi:hypothetical protein